MGAHNIYNTLMDIDTNEDFLDRMAKTFPALMEKATLDDFYIEPGWYDIIEAMFEVICYDYDLAVFKLDNYESVDHPFADIKEYENLCRKDVDDARERLPVISSVKEKYAELVIYSKSRSDASSRAAFRFAEKMSKITCEKCGQRGFRSGNFPEKTYCREHHLEVGNEVDD